MMWRAASGVVDGSMTIGDLVLVNAFLIQLYMPLNFLGVVYREIRQALADIERLFDLLAVNREIADSPNARKLADGAGGDPLRRRSISPTKPTARFCTRWTSRFPPGRTVAVVGESGSGKSTLARLLYRFYDVRGGAILVNGTDLRQLTQASLRAAIGIVPQDTVLFNDTIYYNIQYGNPQANREQVLAAAAAAQLAAFIEQLPLGYETRVGERGLKLSGGEKQRVAIARALLKNPPVLIFDEATSALDSKTEKAIQASLDSAARGRTTLVIAHRLSTIMNADEILVMDSGRIVERGTHQQLLEAAGAYAQMWTLQQLEEAGAAPTEGTAQRWPETLQKKARHPAWLRFATVCHRRSVRLCRRCFAASLQRPVEQLDESHRRVVAIAETALQNPQVTAVAGGIAGPELVEHLDHHVAVAQAVENAKTTVGEARLLAERDDRLDNAPQLLGLRQRRLDRPLHAGAIRSCCATSPDGGRWYDSVCGVPNGDAYQFLPVLVRLLTSRGRPVASSRASCPVSGRGRPALP
jgi:ABC-type methionine transport system ATPase subunit